MFDLRAVVAVAVVAAASGMSSGQAAHLGGYPWIGLIDSSRFGWSVSGAGDVNGDGVPDVIVGSSRPVELPNDGDDYVRVYCGASGELLHTIFSEPGERLFGFSVSGAGDVNNDGFADFLVGVARNSTNGLNAGAVRVYSGATGDLLYELYGDAGGDQFGVSVSGAGDVNNDGHDDFIVGAFSSNANGAASGMARVFCGATGDELHTFLGDGPGDLFGRSVSGAGDVNKDGFADVMVGGHGSDANGANSGMVRVYCGATGDVLYTFTGDGPLAHIGFSVGLAGDVNGDGTDDFVVGAPGNNVNGFNAGMVRVYCGATGDVLHTFYGDAEGDLLGWSVSGVGDVNGDGYDDVIAGAHFSDVAGPDFGMVRVFCGRTGAVLLALYGEQELGTFGLAVAGIGDVNGDGLGDFVVGSPTYSTFDDVYLEAIGMARIYLSAPYACPATSSCDGDADGDGVVDIDDLTYVVLRLGDVCSEPEVAPGVVHGALLPWNGRVAGAQFGYAVSGAGDVNNDGFADLIIGSPFDATLGPGAGAARVVCGTTGSEILTLHIGGDVSWFGFSVDGVGDINGDGRADVIVGAPQYVGVGAGSGMARVFSGLNGTPLMTFLGENAGDNLGYAVGRAGDVNNDGVGDVIVGAPGAGLNGAGSGIARVFCGASASVLHTFVGASSMDRLGHSVAGPGDLNGDGHADLIVGAPFHDANGSNSGAAYVYCGATGAILYTFLGDQAGDRLGSSVAGAGDVNGDGVGDLIVGAPMGTPGYARVYCGASGVVLFTFASTVSGDDFGGSVSGAGDVNGDGYADLIVGVSRSSVAATNAGGARVFCGATGDELYAWYGNSIGDRFGTSVSGVGDVNGDGFADMVIGANMEDYNGSNSGSAWLFVSAAVSCPPPASCDGDADGSGIVTIDDLTFVVLRLGNMCPEVCP